MKISVVELKDLFYLYCALLYNNNTTVSYSKKTEEIKNKVYQILESGGVEKLEMPDHRYQYLTSLLNSPKPTHLNIISYVNKLSKIPELQKLLESEKAQLQKNLKAYAPYLENIKMLFETHFDYEPKVKEFYVTRNWDKSGMMIPTPEHAYIVVGWNSATPNIRNLIHEITHAYVNEVDLKITNKITKIIEGLPDSILDNYHKAYTIVSESVVRALVIYLSSVCPSVPKQAFSEEDLALQLPVLFLDRLQKDKPPAFSRVYLSNLVTK